MGGEVYPVLTQAFAPNKMLGRQRWIVRAWSNPQQAEVYTRKADRRRLSIAASARQEERFKDITPLTLEPGARKKSKSN